MCLGREQMLADFVPLCSNVLYWSPLPLGNSQAQKVAFEQTNISHGTLFPKQYTTMKEITNQHRFPPL